MSVRSRFATAAPMLVLVLVTSLASCSNSDGSDPETSGPTKQAVERLQDFGLAADEATCIVEEVGAASVVEATDLNAYTESQQYRDAAEACIG